MATLTPTTELEAVNQMLAAIGESPVNRVTDSGNLDAATALATLTNVSREVQAKGWHWNTDLSFTIVPDEDGYLRLGASVLSVDTVGANEGDDLVQRGTRLYDRVNHTYEFENSVVVDQVVFLPFDELPEVARSYINIRASRRFQENHVGSETLSRFNSIDEARALSSLQSAEAENADYRVVNGSFTPNGVINR